jgi:hypothetical protein
VKKYKFFPQEENMCLAACLQSVLDARGFPAPSQHEIAGHFNVRDRGVNLDKKLLNSFLSGYNLTCAFVRPSENLIEPDILISSFPSNADSLIFYDYGKLNKDGQGRGHFSLLSDFQHGKEKEVFLHDNIAQRILEVRLEDLINSMRIYSNCGFYLIN